MGEKGIQTDLDDGQMRSFVRALLEDVQALERMLEGGMIETDVRRIGAEQEIFLIGQGGAPANKALELQKRLGQGPYANELGLFNFELNLKPQELGGDCLSAMETELEHLLQLVRGAAAEEGIGIVLCGILPTLDKTHLGLDSMTPIPRFHLLNNVMCELRGGEFRTMIKGLDELQLTHDNVMLEACNTSFQVHFQVGGPEFAKLYNLAQAVTAPVLAAGVNSPVLLQHRLWHETRVALFQQSIDVRSEHKTLRGGRQRVHFGDKWVKDSVLEIYREDIARFRSLITMEPDEASLELLEQGIVPRLRALCLHNGTIYRWNRPCYGVQDGLAHLRIENRVLPAGPTVLDEMANAAFYFGLMCALGDEYGDITRVMSFDDAKGNFMAAARYGLNARFRWVHGRPCGADELILGHLLPLARSGLESRKIQTSDIERYLGCLEQRVRSGRTGAQWALDSLAQMGDRGTSDERYRALTGAMVKNQGKSIPVSAWKNAALEDAAGARESYRTVGQVMTTDLFTVHPEDVVDLAASLMDWEHIRYVPVEDNDGHLVGLVSHRALLRMLARGISGNGAAPVAVREIMKTHPVTVTPDTSCMNAIDTMREHKVGCLPVVRGGKLVGIVTEHDFMTAAAGLLDRWLRGELQ
jgi:CBS domain-containing protein